MKNKTAVKAAFLSLDCPVYEGVSQKGTSFQREKRSQSIFIFISGNQLEEEPLSRGISKLKKNGKAFSFFVERGMAASESLKILQKRHMAKASIQGEPFDRLEEMVLEAEAVFLPLLSLKMASKLALGLVDEFAVAFLWQCLVAGVPVYACTTGLMEGYTKAPLPMKHQVEQYLETLKGYGLNVVDELPEIENSKSGLKSEGVVIRLSDSLSKQVITQWHIMGLEKGSRLMVGRSVLVTPLAKDVAKSRKIEFVLE